MKALKKHDRARLLLAASLLTPILAVQGVRLLVDAGPTSAAADTIAGDALPAPVPAPAAVSLTPAQRQAAQWLGEYARLDTPHSLYSDVRSPMDHPVPRAEPEPEQPQPEPAMERPEQLPKELDPHARLHISSIMVDREHAVAFINGRLYHIGESPMKGWTIIHIDGKLRIVTLVDVDGHEAVLSQAME